MNNQNSNRVLLLAVLVGAIVFLFEFGLLGNMPRIAGLSIEADRTGLYALEDSGGCYYIQNDEPDKNFTLKANISVYSDSSQNCDLLRDLPEHKQYFETNLNDSNSSSEKQVLRAGLEAYDKKDADTVYMIRELHEENDNPKYQNKGLEVIEEGKIEDLKEYKARQKGQLNYVIYLIGKNSHFIYPLLLIVFLLGFKAILDRLLLYGASRATEQYINSVKSQPQKLNNTNLEKLIKLNNSVLEEHYLSALQYYKALILEKDVKDEK